MPLLGYEEAYEKASRVMSGLRRVTFEDTPEVRKSQDGICLGRTLMTEDAVKGLCKVLGIAGAPAYLAKCPPRLQAVNLDFWSRDRRIFDEYAAIEEKGRIAFFLPKSLRAIPDTQVLEAASKAFEKSEMTAVVETEKASFSRDRTRFSVYLASGRVDAGKDDPLYPGFHFENSQTGLSKLMVSGYVHREVCTNGLIAPVDYASETFTDGADIVGDLKDFLEAMLPRAEEEVRRLIKLKEVSVDDPTAVLMSITGTVGFSDQQRARLVDRMNAEEPIENMYDLVNHITAYANGMSSRNASSIQRRAGQVVRQLSTTSVCSSCHSVVYSRNKNDTEQQT